MRAEILYFQSGEVFFGLSPTGAQLAQTEWMVGPQLDSKAIDLDGGMPASIYADPASRADGEP